MRHARLSLWLAGASTLAAFAAAPASPAEARVFRMHYDHVLGTSLDIAVVADSEVTAMIAAEAAKAEIARLDAVLSTWRPDSEIGRLNLAEGRVRVSPDLFAVLSRAEAWRTASGGAYDPRLGEVERAWRAPGSGVVERAGGAAGAEGGAPAARRLARLTAAATREDLALDPGTRTLVRPTGVRLAVDGLAKGYIVDAAAKAARRAVPGVAGVMVDIGGDVRCLGRGPCAEGWRVGVADPAAAQDGAEPAVVLRLTDKAVATSGRGVRDLVVAGRPVSQTLSPVDGRPVQGVVSATVVADRAADADALATAFSVLPVRDSLALADSFDGVAALLVSDDGRRHVSRRWSALAEGEGQAPRLIRASLAPVAAAATLPAGLGLDLQYEVPAIDAPNYKKPFVVIWVTDQDKQLVKTLLILGQRAKWQEDNYVWWRRFGRRDPTILDTVSKPTRPPGRYAVAWDGTDEQGGRVAPGRYTVHVEAAREHGGHSYQSIDLDLGAQPVEQVLPAKDEVGALKLRYGKRK